MAPAGCVPWWHHRRQPPSDSTPCTTIVRCCAAAKEGTGLRGKSWKGPCGRTIRLWGLNAARPGDDTWPNHTLGRTSWCSTLYDSIRGMTEVVPYGLTEPHRSDILLTKSPVAVRWQTLPPKSSAGSPNLSPPVRYPAWSLVGSGHPADWLQWVDLQSGSLHHAWYGAVLDLKDSQPISNSGGKRFVKYLLRQTYY